MLLPHSTLSLSTSLYSSLIPHFCVAQTHSAARDTHTHSFSQINLIFCHLHIYTTLSCSITAIVLNCCGENTKSLVVVLVQIDRELRNTVK